jgi:hypothetical protein
LPTGGATTAPANGDGEPGQWDLSVALGGIGNGGGGDDGRGGNGGVSSTVPTSGDGGQDGTGGGGGGAGRLRVNTMPGQRTETAFTTSAAYTTGTIALQ